MTKNMEEKLFDTLLNIKRRYYPNEKTNFDKELKEYAEKYNRKEELDTILL